MARKREGRRRKEEGNFGRGTKEGGARPGTGFDECLWRSNFGSKICGKYQVFKIDHNEFTRKEECYS